MENLKQWIGQSQALITEFSVRVIAAIAIFFVGRWLAQLLRRIIRNVMTQAGIEATLIAFTCNLSFYGFMVFVVLAALSQVGIETTSLIAVLGAAGLAIGLALQGSLSNFAAGMLIIIFHPFRVGDWVQCSGGISGYVEDIQIFTTIIRTLDNKTVIVPNSSMTRDNIINYSTKGILRLDLIVGVAYHEDIDHVKRVIHQVLQADDRILDHPAPIVGVLEFADSSITFAVRPWVHPQHYWPVHFTTLENLKKRFDAEDISIPFPRRDVHLYSVQDSMSNSVPMNSAQHQTTQSPTGTHPN